MIPMLQVEGIDAFYGLAHILRGLSLDVGSGEVVALLGRNGAGKSTTIKTIMGLIRPSGGRIIFDGRDIHGKEAHVIARLGLGYVPEERRIFTDLTVRENLEVGRKADAEGQERWTLERVFGLFPVLDRLYDRQGGHLSGGEQQMLSIGRTLMGNPRLVLLDEPAEGLAPVVVDHLAEGLRKLKSEGLAILISDQNLRFAGSVADRAFILEKGEVRFRGSLDALRADSQARSAYLEV